MACEVSVFSEILQLKFTCYVQNTTVGVERKIILFAPLPDRKVADLLIYKSDGPFLKMGLMKFLSSIHEMCLLDKVTRIYVNCWRVQLMKCGINRILKVEESEKYNVY